MSHQIFLSQAGILGQAQATLAQIQDLNDQMFDLPTDQTRTLFNTFSHGIEALQTQARTLEERATVSRAKEALTAVQEQLAIIAPTETTAQPHLPVRKYFADHNQYDARYAGIHPIETDRNSACTCIAPCAVLSLLQNGRGADFNAVIAQGQQMMVHALADQRQDPFIDGEHITFADIAEVRFPELEVVVPTEFTGFGFYPKMLRHDTQAVFQEVIQSLLDLRNIQGNESIGCVITSHGESGSLMVLPHPDHSGQNLFVHSDSHGSRELNDNNPHAYLIEFDHAEDAARFLSLRYPFVENMGEHYNMMNLYPVVLRNEVPVAIAAQHIQVDPTPTVLWVQDVAPIEPAYVEVASVQTISSSVQAPTASAVNPHLFQAAATLNLMREQVDPLLARADDDVDLQLLTRVAELQSSDLKAVFKISSNDPWNVSDRLFFHTYFIHANETPDRIPRDIDDYGRLAFLNFATVGSEPMEKTRAIQRTLIEVSLEGLEDAILNNNGERARYYLNLLDQFDLHEKDRIENYSRASHSLFATLYQRYNLARETDQMLVSPHDPAFQGDFGRHGFRDEAVPHQIPQAIKLEVIHQIREQYQQKWRI